MIRFLRILILKHRRQCYIDDRDHYSGVIAHGQRQLAQMIRDNRYREAKIEEINRKLYAVETSRALLSRALRRA